MLALATDESLTLADRVVPVVLGALIALVGAVIVQLWLVPRVDTRRRREHRWEEDVLALGQLLTLDHPRVVNELCSELHWLVLLVLEPPEDVDTASEKWATLKAEHRELLRAARSEYDALCTRVDWLTDRIVSLAPRSAVLGRFSALERQHMLARSEVSMLEWRPNLPNEPPLTEDEINEAADKVRTAARDMVTAVKGLATNRPPRNSLRRRLRWWWASKVRPRLRRQRTPD